MPLSTCLIFNQRDKALMFERYMAPNRREKTSQHVARRFGITGPARAAAIVKQTGNLISKRVVFKMLLTQPVKTGPQPNVIGISLHELRKQLGFFHVLSLTNGWQHAFRQSQAILNIDLIGQRICKVLQIITQFHFQPVMMPEFRQAALQLLFAFHGRFKQIN